MRKEKPTKTKTQLVKVFKWSTSQHNKFIIKYFRWQVFDLLRFSLTISYFCVTPQKSYTSLVYIIFPQITKKILTKYMFHWMELITEILSFLQIFSVRNPTTQFLIFQKICKKANEKGSI